MNKKLMINILNFSRWNNLACPRGTAGLCTSKLTYDLFCLYFICGLNWVCNKFIVKVTVSIQSAMKAHGRREESLETILGVKQPLYDYEMQELSRRNRSAPARLRYCNNVCRLWASWWVSSIHCRSKETFCSRVPSLGQAKVRLSRFSFGLIPQDFPPHSLLVLKQILAIINRWLSSEILRRAVM